MTTWMVKKAGRGTVKMTLATLTAATRGCAPMPAQGTEPAACLARAATVLREIAAAPDKGIPENLVVGRMAAIQTGSHATLREDLHVNATQHGRRLGNREVVADAVPPQPAAGPLALLNGHSASERRD